MPMWKRRLFARLMDKENGGEGGSGGGSGDSGEAGKVTPELQAQIDAQVAREVAGLKAKNSELIAANKELKSKFDALNSQFEGFDIEAVKGLLTKASQDEETKLIAEGKIDDVINRRIERFRAEVDKQLKAKDDEIARRVEANKRLAGRALSDAITQAAAKAGVHPDALPTAVLIAEKRGWVVDDDGNVIAKRGDDVVLGKDGKTPLTVKEWAESLLESDPYLFPEAKGTGAPGSSSQGGGRPSAANKKARDMTPQEKADFIGQNGLKAWSDKLQAEFA